MRPELRLAHEWLFKAKRDMVVAKMTAENPSLAPDVWGFHLQQTVEKSLKAFLQLNGCDIERTHDLVFLLQQCTHIDHAFAEWMDAAQLMSGYAVQFRYPGPSDPPEDQLRVATRAAEAILATVESRLR